MSEQLKVIADVSSLQGSNRDRGISRYSENLLLALATHKSLALSLRVHPRMMGLKIGHPLERMITAESQIVEQLKTDRETRTIYLITSPFESVDRASELLPDWVNEYRVPTVAILYDLIPKLFPEVYLPNAVARRWYEARLALVQSCDALLSISEATRQDALNELTLDGPSVVTIGAGVDTSFFNGAPSPRSNQVVCVAGYEPRKNVPRLLEAWASLQSETRKRHELVVICTLPDDGRQHWESIARRSGLTNGEVKFTGHISDEGLRDYYRSAKLVVAPYLYEGFGLPVAEAACCGAPVIYSRTSSLPEILKNPIAEFDPTDTRSIAQLLERALNDDDYLSHLEFVSRTNGPTHTWSAVAERARAAMSRAARTPGGRLDMPRKLRFVSPFSPALSGVAVYSSEIVAELPRDVNIEIFEDRSPSDRETQGQRPVLSQARGLARRPQRSGSSPFLIALGNSDYHMNSLDLALAGSVNLWLHDLALTGLVTSRARRFRDVGFRIDWINNLLAVGRHSVGRVEVDRSSHLDDSFYRRNGVRFIEPVLAGARKVIVNSQLARSVVLATELVDQDQVKSVPLAFRQRSDWYPRARSPIIVSMGWVGPMKRPLTLIESIREIDVPAKLVFAGPADLMYVDVLTRHAELNGVSDRVIFTGPLTDDDYWRWCCEAWIGVQLRQGSNAESSAALNDLMSSGTPVITDIPSAFEMPNESMIHIAPDSTPTDLANVINTLISDRNQRETIGARAREVASSWTYRDVAESVISFLA